ncbi:diguanylate cyclase [Spirulina sp. CS-785/01]|uniref:diguanylate cyclase domain-containing protein n=1 Tax=Spirulina sp. CS-785/01 TaxID=3021716 RepID=UPI00232B9035|nr:diguanylate cyclase [Spirulina sp. CS-785/01]MDB9314656.1 diguanylate cyclase [Spirulina sp. CS-785/01]
MFWRKLNLQAVFILPFVLEITVTVGVVGYLSYRNGEKAVETLANALINEVGDRIEEHINYFLEIPVNITQNGQDLIETQVFNLQDMDAWLPYLIIRYQHYRNSYIDAIMITNANNEFRAAGQAKNKAGNTLTGIAVAGEKTEFQWKTYADFQTYQNSQPLGLSLDSFYATQRPWYQEAVDAKRATWISIFSRLSNEKILALNFSQPLFLPKEDDPQGVMSIQINLIKINQFLQSLKIGENGQAFVIEKTGYLVATSTQESLISQNIDDQVERLKATQSQDKLTQKVTQYLTKKMDYFTNKDNNKLVQKTFLNKPYFFKIIDLKNEYGLDWLIVVVVPEEDFMQVIHKNTRNTMILSIFALSFAVLIGILTARWVTVPISKFNQAAKKISQGHWEQKVDIQREDELGQLATSFNRMAEQLQRLFQDLSESQYTLNQYLESLPVGVVVHNPNGSIAYLNPKAKKLLNHHVIRGVDNEHLAAIYQIYKSGTEMLYPIEELPSFQALQGRKFSADDLEFRYGDHNTLFEVTGTPIRDSQGNIIRAIIVFQDITNRKQAEQVLKNYNKQLEQQVKARTAALEQANQTLQELATIDALTQVKNRRYFQEMLIQEWQRCLREQTPLSLILCDVDYFKLYNDTYGHLAGDACLKAVATALRQTVQRPGDLVARYGGEEFVILLPNTPPEGISLLAEVIRQQLHQEAIPHRESKISAWVTLSLGGASVIPTSTLSSYGLVNAADQALYMAKEQGRDRFIFSPWPHQ